MTPMPQEIPRTLAAYRMIIGKVQAALAHCAARISPHEALTLAFLPPERITVRGAKAKALFVGTNAYQTVDRLHKAGLVICSDREGKGGGPKGGKLAVELTPSGVALAEAVRKALGGQEMRLEAAE